eukprot:Unigene9646_Nuclearia_a/m.29475 Unigene9646_Nuclearia_a/g.29475  ORF Unigene9646_Nuclearia_a/g.29475 Unigene9646_Nuclearia_a/m.29475 type:complete len:429 (-) Unigene9646_Nuclearia_a:33-1319(-)
MAAPHDDYAREPRRNPALRVNKERPFNAEPPAALLVRSGFVTPNELFLVRNHGPVPLYEDLAQFSLTVDGLVLSRLHLTLAELRAGFERVTVVATIQCAGNRRNDFARSGRKVKGVGWEQGALSTGVWAGVRLSDVLSRAQVLEGARHVVFEGDDHCYEEQCGKDYTFKYGASIPLHKAMSALGDVILAYEMNGEVLSRDRGYPLRVVVPGHIGARSVKWLRRITVQKEEAPHFHQQRDYKLFPPSVDWDNVEALWAKTPSMQEINVQSAICDPENGSNPGKGPYTIRGYALSGGGRRIDRVDLSFDSGKTWVTAELHRLHDHGDEPRHYAWTLWSYEAKILPSPCTIVCRAWDAASNTQPAEAQDIWNLRGVGGNHYCRITVNTGAPAARGPPTLDASPGDGEEYPSDCGPSAAASSASLAAVPSNL